MSTLIPAGMGLDGLDLVLPGQDEPFSAHRADGGAGDPAWFAATHDDLPAAIAELKAKLPGWWYSICECQVSCDATIAPTGESPDIAITYALPARSPFDQGFEVALSQPSTLAEALRFVIAQALEAKADYRAQFPLAVQQARGAATASPAHADLGPGKTKGTDQ